MPENAGRGGDMGLHENTGTAAARAYLGAAHGQTWEITEDLAPTVVALPDRQGGRVAYRLLRRRTGRLATDHQGNVVYLVERQTP